MVEAAVEAGVDGIRLCKRVLAEQLVRLTKQGVDVAALIELSSVLNAHVGASAAFHAIPAGKLVDREEIGIVKQEALAGLIRPLADLRFIRPGDDLRNWLDS